ncbi:hypothetical protein Hanom_Chr00s000717g01655721 [Helianthus anomalus]
MSRQQKQQGRRQWIPTTVFQVKRIGGAGDRLTGGDDGGGRQTWLQHTGEGGGDFNSFRQVHREDTRRRWWLPPKLR